MPNWGSWHLWINVYTAVGLIFYGQYITRDKLKNPDVDWVVRLITRVLIVVAAVIWPITELIGLGMMIEKDDKR